MVSTQEKILLTHPEIMMLIDKLADQLIALLPPTPEWVIVGIRRGGATLAKHLRQRLKHLGHDPKIGFLDITFYRDDLNTVGPNPLVGATDLSMGIDDKQIILVDDVLFTGRTIRAALNALFDYGRPQKVDLLVLVDRNHRQLPIRSDFLGLALPGGERESIKLLESRNGELTVVRRFLS
ncbi:MAG: bifunctional pyr operon transcriptional regulator/uracil phosphoribosyltransferase PyrR [Magnetococcus sp. DMHC-6]